MPQCNPRVRTLVDEVVDYSSGGNAATTHAAARRASALRVGGPATWVATTYSVAARLWRAAHPTAPYHVQDVVSSAAQVVLRGGCGVVGCGASASRAAALPVCRQRVVLRPPYPASLRPRSLRCTVADGRQLLGPPGVYPAAGAIVFTGGHDPRPGTRRRGGRQSCGGERPAW